MADTRTIAKNTLFLYFRMILVMGIAIYTSRVILAVLGIDDYGLYNAVASVVAIISFLNVTLSTSTSRFLTYELERKEKLETTFATSLYSHLILAVIIVIVMETIGLWYLNNRFVIPEGREWATNVTFQISIFISIVAVVSVPYTASIMSHEQMGFFAGVSIVEVTLQLLIVYLLMLSPEDKLVIYAILLLCVRLFVFFLYFYLCYRQFYEVKHPFRQAFNRQLFTQMLKFTGWSVVANLSNTVIVQGATLLLNLFFAPAVVAAKALSNQITSAMMNFANNFRAAMNPQIIKSFAAEKYEEHRKMVLKSTTISFDLMLIMGLPCIFTMKDILNIWLVEVPPYAVEFAQIAIATQILEIISASTYITFLSSNKLAANSVIGLLMGLLYFIILYFIYKNNGSVFWVQYLYFILVIIGILVARPLLLTRQIGYKLRDVFLCYWQCLKVMIPSLLISFVLYKFLPEGPLYRVLLFMTIVFICIVFSYVFLENSMKQLINSYIKQKCSYFFKK